MLYFRSIWTIFLLGYLSHLKDALGGVVEVNMKDTLGYFSKYSGITLTALYGFYGFHKIVEMFSGDLTVFQYIFSSPHL